VEGDWRNSDVTYSVATACRLPIRRRTPARACSAADSIESARAKIIITYPMQDDIDVVADQ